MLCLLNNSVTKYLLNIHLSFKFKASEETPAYTSTSGMPASARLPGIWLSLGLTGKKRKHEKKTEGESERERKARDTRGAGRSLQLMKKIRCGVRRDNRSHPALSVTSRRQDS